MYSMKREVTSFAREKGEKSETGETRGRGHRNQRSEIRRQRSEIRGQKKKNIDRELD